MSKPLFTVITITYNSGRWVRQAIESILTSSFADFEYIIADDCSTDDTWKIIQEYNDPRINAWKNEQNLGEYNNRNLTLQKASGEFIIYIDGDDILYRDTLQEFASYIKAFPDTAGVWCVYYHFFNFMVFPYQLSPLQLTRFNFLSMIPVAIVGLTESVFRTSALKEIGGFDPSYATADTHAKKRFSCKYPVVLIPAGKAFWRHSPNQASQQVRKKMRNLVESFTMDQEILESAYFPLQGKEREQANFNFRNRRIKLVVSMTLMKGDIYNFIRLMRILKIPVFDLLQLLKNGDYSYRSDADGENPLMNDFNFKKI